MQSHRSIRSLTIPSRHLVRSFYRRRHGRRDRKLNGRLIIENEPCRGTWNMAVDEVLLESAIEYQVPTVRLYQWSEATVSLGYFQCEFPNPSERWGDLPIVRRLSGGGAILHHHELTYSFALPQSHPLTRDPRRLYEKTHLALIEFLKESGIATSLRGSAAKERDSAFLCFSRGDALDVLHGIHKVIGSAQRRRRGAVLQHGSILLESSEYAPEFPGILDLADNISFPDGMSAGVADALSQTLFAKTTSESLTEQEQAHATRLQKNRYARLEWKSVK